MDLKFSVFPRHQSPGFLIYRASTLLRAGLKGAFQDAGFNVTPEQWAILSSLWELDGMHQSALAERTAKDRHNVTRILNLLEKADLVRREPHGQDKRCQKVFLTDKGKEIKEDLVPIAMNFLGRALRGLTQEDLRVMNRILTQVIENVGGSSDRAGVSDLSCKDDAESPGLTLPG